MTGLGRQQMKSLATFTKLLLLDSIYICNMFGEAYPMQCIGVSSNPALQAAGILSKYYLCSDQIQFSNVANCEVSTARKKATFCSISTEPPTSPLLSSLLLTAQVFTLTTYTFQNLSLLITLSNASTSNPSQFFKFLVSQ